jgi:hypothetical protein
MVSAFSGKSGMMVILRLMSSLRAMTEARFTYSSEKKWCVNSAKELTHLSFNALYWHLSLINSSSSKLSILLFPYYWIIFNPLIYLLLNSFCLLISM